LRRRPRRICHGQVTLTEVARRTLARCSRGRPSSRNDQLRCRGFGPPFAVAGNELLVHGRARATRYGPVCRAAAKGVLAYDVRDARTPSQFIERRLTWRTATATSRSRRIRNAVAGIAPRFARRHPALSKCARPAYAAQILLATVSQATTRESGAHRAVTPTRSMEPCATIMASRANGRQRARRRDGRGAMARLANYRLEACRARQPPPSTSNPPWPADQRSNR